MESLLNRIRRKGQKKFTSEINKIRRRGKKTVNVRDNGLGGKFVLKLRKWLDWIFGDWNYTKKRENQKKEKISRNDAWEKVQGH